MTNWYTSDLHFNHKNILNYENRTRNFTSVEEMNEKLIENWNSVVKQHDQIYVLGDFILGKPDEVELERIVYRLNGKISLIPGNHDSLIKLRIYESNRLLEVVSPLLETKNPAFVMCHFPLATWHHDYKGMKHLHGHTHGNFPKDKYKRMDVGVDTHPEFRPYHIDEITQYMKDKINKGNHHDV